MLFSLELLTKVWYYNYNKKKWVWDEVGVRMI